MEITLLGVITMSAIFLVIYHHIGYPLILKCIPAKEEASPQSTATRRYNNVASDEMLPSVTVIIPAYNEERWIAEKIRNLAVLDYPNHRLQIFIACDGCSDKTEQIAKATAREPACRHLNLTVIGFKNNRGKVALLNDLIPTASSDLVALSDVSALVSADALLLAAHRFSNKELGVLNSHYQLYKPGTNGENVYWKYQSLIKSKEASMGSTMGAHGAFYMFRTNLFEPLAPDTINDDFILPMKIVAMGYKAEQENRITALELESSNLQTDFRRRLRIAAGNLQQVLRLGFMLHPRHGGVAFIFLSGKALRVMMPYLMIMALAGSISLAGTSPFFSALAVSQLSIYFLSSLPVFFSPFRRWKPTRLLQYLVAGHLANFIGSLRYLLGLDKGRWHRVVQPENSRPSRSHYE
ncbi:glycosyltransferase family 2 protein [Parasalinivibrio latis]|uniref:glycosyltransferase family 2 protein n=1 Tax=Parasalinivibrio latis TaxID=2952610 RepID=UPI0030E4934C